MARYRCTIAHYRFLREQLADMVAQGNSFGIGDLDNLAKKLFADLLNDQNVEIIRDIHFSNHEDAHIADVAHFVESGA
jgi:hypothetical protein